MPQATAPEPVPPEALKPWIEGGFEALRQKTGFPGWAPKENQFEIETISKQAAFSLNKHFPSVSNSPYFDLVILASTVVGVGLSKYRAQLEWQKFQAGPPSESKAS